MSRSWKRLRLIQVDLSTAERLLQLAKALETQETPHERTRRDAASYLRRLADAPKALKALESRVGRPAFSSQAPDVALDYLIHRRIFGRGNAEKAKREVARAWSVSRDTVRDAFTDWRTGAEHRLSELLQTAMRQTADEVEALKMISLDLRDIARHERKAQKKSS